MSRRREMRSISVSPILRIKEVVFNCTSTTLVFLQATMTIATVTKISDRGINNFGDEKLSFETLI